MSVIRGEEKMKWVKYVFVIMIMVGAPILHKKIKNTKFIQFLNDNLLIKLFSVILLIVLMLLLVRTIFV